MIRNGVAHQYRDCVVQLKDGKWLFSIKGVRPGWTLSKVEEERRSLHHLDNQEDKDGHIITSVHPGVFFLDIRDAVRNAKLLSQNPALTIDPWDKPRGCELRSLKRELLKSPTDPTANTGILTNDGRSEQRADCS